MFLIFYCLKVGNNVEVSENGSTLTIIIHVYVGCHDTIDTTSSRQYELSTKPNLQLRNISNVTLEELDSSSFITTETNNLSKPRWNSSSSLRDFRSTKMPVRPTPLRTNYSRLTSRLSSAATSVTTRRPKSRKRTTALGIHITAASQTTMKPFFVHAAAFLRNTMRLLRRLG